jgi:hypothetical protein
MTTIAPASRQELLDVFATVGHQFDSARLDIKNREKVLDVCLKNAEKARAVTPWNQSPLPKDHPLRKMAAQCLEEINPMLDAWLQDVSNYDRGTKFRAGFDDSLLIFVYGKVKAGKSSLGNFLAYGETEPTTETIDAASPQPFFFWTEGTGANEVMSSTEMNRKRHFGVGALETTSSIQGFTLPGLTWIDSPGVHSMNAVNGQLAKDYAASADLVIFLSNSSSPGRRSDLAEIKDLLEKQKTLMVLLTASDFFDDDIDDEGNETTERVMKSEEDRQGQIELLSIELAAFNDQLEGRLKETQVHSVSVSYAQEGNSEDQNRRWNDSGLAEFAANIADIANSQGLALKRETPLRNLAAFCTRLLESLDRLDTSLGEIRSSLKEAREQLHREGENALIYVGNSLSVEVDKLADQHAMNDSAFSTACWKAFDDIYSQYASKLCTGINQSFDDLAVNAQAIMPTDTGIPGFSQRTEKLKFKSSKYESVGKAGGGGLGGFGGAEAGMALGTLLMPGIGTAIGGVLGAALGAWAGSKAGAAAGRPFNEETEYDFAVGDNRLDVSLETRKHLVTRAELKIAALCGQLDQLCFVDIENWLKGFNDSLQQLRLQANTHRVEIEEELTHGTA